MIRIIYKRTISFKEIWNIDNIFVNLPERTSSLISFNLFLVKIKRTNLVMFKNAPFWISSIRLLVRFTERSLGWVRKARGVRVSESILMLWLEKWIWAYQCEKLSFEYIIPYSKKNIAWFMKSCSYYRFVYILDIS